MDVITYPRRDWPLQTHGYFYLNQFKICTYIIAYSRYCSLKIIPFWPRIFKDISSFPRLRRTHTQQNFGIFLTRFSISYSLLDYVLSSANRLPKSPLSRIDYGRWNACKPQDLETTCVSSWCLLWQIILIREAGGICWGYHRYVITILVPQSWPNYMLETGWASERHLVGVSYDI